MDDIREIHIDKVTDTVRDLCVRACTYLPDDLKKGLADALKKEKSEMGKEVLKQIVDNYKIAESDRVPLCQDTGITVVLLEVGQDCHLVGGEIKDAVNEGVRRGYDSGGLRKSVVTDPLFARRNTKDNSPAVIHTDIVRGSKVRIRVFPKGAGSENMSRISIFPPSVGKKEIKDFIIETVLNAGPNACPPMIVGVGIGSNFEGVAMLAKSALMRSVGSKNQDVKYAEFEGELLREINDLGLGPQGLGGINTALAVNIETFPCHIASVPVAVNIQCHAARYAEAVI